MENAVEMNVFPEFQPVMQSRTRTAIIVDDDPAQLEILAYRLEKLGFQTEQLGLGRTLIPMARRLQPDLIIMDVELPDSDGLDLCNQLMDCESTSQIPVIILSGTRRSDVVRSARAAGSRFYVSKPYDPNALMLIIDAAIHDDR
jgi:DNA-binding response OmpR family regulator